MRGHSPKLGAAIGQLYTYTATATVPDSGTATFSLLESPAGMTIDASSGLVQWTPTAAEAGQNIVTVAAIDSQGLGGTQRFAITVQPLATPQFSTNPVTAITAGQNNILAGD